MYTRKSRLSRYKQYELTKKYGRKAENILNEEIEKGDENLGNFFVKAEYSKPKRKGNGRRVAFDVEERESPYIRFAEKLSKKHGNLEELISSIESLGTSLFPNSSSAKKDFKNISNKLAGIFLSIEKLKNDPEVSEPTLNISTYLTELDKIKSNLDEFIPVDEGEWLINGIANNIIQPLIDILNDLNPSKAVAKQL